MKPSDIFLNAVPPLTGTFGKSEREAAAALLVNACRVHGDVFGPVTPKMVGQSMNLDEEPWKSLSRNPFFRPDFRALADAGYAAFDGDPNGHNVPIRFTEKGLAALRGSRWLRSPAVGKESGAPT